MSVDSELTIRLEQWDDSVDVHGALLQLSRANDETRAELADVRSEYAVLRENSANVQRRVEALERLGPAMCKCGHKGELHSARNVCLVKDCPCMKFRTAEQPAVPAPARCKDGTHDWGITHDGWDYCKRCSMKRLDRTAPAPSERCPICLGRGYDLEGDPSEIGLTNRLVCDVCHGSGKVDRTAPAPAGEPPVDGFPRYIVWVGFRQWTVCGSLVEAMGVLSRMGGTKHALVYEPLAATAAERICAEPPDAAGLVDELAEALRHEIVSKSHWTSCACRSCMVLRKYDSIPTTRIREHPAAVAEGVYDRATCEALIIAFGRSMPSECGVSSSMYRRRGWLDAIDLLRDVAGTPLPTGGPTP